MNKREIKREKYQRVISEVKKSPNYNEKEVTKFIWRNALKALPLLNWKENPNNLSESQLVKENLILMHYIFNKIDLILFNTILKEDDDINLGDKYGYDNLDLCYSYLKAKFGDYRSIFFGNSSFTGLEYPISLFNELIEAVYGEGKANKYDRTIKYEFGISEELETFGILDFKERWDVFIEFLRINDCNYWADYFIMLFENNFELSDAEMEKLRKRVIISRTLSQNIWYFEDVAPANEVASIIELSDRLNFTEEEIGRLIKIWKCTIPHNSLTIFEIIRSKMNSIKM